MISLSFHIIIFTYHQQTIRNDNEFSEVCTTYQSLNDNLYLFLRQWNFSYAQLLISFFFNLAHACNLMPRNALVHLLFLWLILRVFQKTFNDKLELHEWMHELYDLMKKFIIRRKYLFLWKKLLSIYYSSSIIYKIFIHFIFDIWSRNIEKWFNMNLLCHQLTSIKQNEKKVVGGILITNFQLCSKVVRATHNHKKRWSRCYL